MSKKEKLTTGEILLDIIDYSAVLFRDPAGLAWARINGECHPVRSTTFRRHIQRKFYHLEGKAPHTQAVQEAIEQAEGKALFEGRFTKKVHVRNAYQEGKIFIDLGDEDKTIAEVTEGGYNNLTTEATYFHRPSGLEALPIPKQGQIEDLKRFLNYESEGDFKLLIAWMLAALNPDIACPILILQGEQGSAKSTTSKIIRALTDPNTAPIRTAPRDERELIIQGENARVICLDNLSGVKSWLSDALCRICTGGGFSARKLYTDSEEKIFQIRRPIILNGIDDIATRGDLLDRAIVLSLPAIPQGKRKDESTFWNEFEQAKPGIFGALLVGLCHGLKYQDEIKLNRLPRMADFARWVQAATKAYAWNDVVSLYFNNRNNAVETGLDSDILASAIRKIVANTSEYRNTATHLIEKIKEVSPDTNERYLPTTRTLKSRLTRLSPALRQIGITWDRIHTENGNEYFIKKSPLNASEDSEDSEINKNNGLDTEGALKEHEATPGKASGQKHALMPVNGNPEGTEASEAIEQQLFNKEMARLEGYPVEDETPF